MKIKLTKKQKRQLAFYFITCTVLTIITLLFLKYLLPHKSSEDIATTVAGIMGTYLSFLGSVFVFIALKAQVEANQLVQDQFKEQEKSSYKQNFETTFFNLLNIHHNIVNSMDFNAEVIEKYSPELTRYIRHNRKYYFSIVDSIDNAEEFKSRDVFKFTNNVLHNLLHDDLTLNSFIDNTKYLPDELIILNNYFNRIERKSLFEITLNNYNTNTNFTSIYIIIYSKVNSDFGHYFRNLYRIFKFVDECNFDNDKLEDFKIKYKYTSIIRSQLSDDEISWLFFNCLTDLGSKKFKPLLEKYSVLKVIRNEYPYRYYIPHYKSSAIIKNWENNIEEHINKFEN